ncbi:MAG TPA: hypothetical protein VNR18_01510, partial [Hyphomicrobiales bacterium]|nr:hypothetical protein [Hyphomicrobiales bacterium]
TDDYRGAVLPALISQAGADEAEGVGVNEDGDIVFITANRRVVISYPLVVDNTLFMQTLQALGLRLDYDARANLLVEAETTEMQALLDDTGISRHASALNEETGLYYALRPHPLALPAPAGAEEGLHARVAPELPTATLLSLVFKDERGLLLEQDLIPVPADWPALKAALRAIPGLTQVRIDLQGIISVQLEGRTLRGRVSYAVLRSGVPSGANSVLVQGVGDLNGDGTGDFELHYPNGDLQRLLILP